MTIKLSWPVSEKSIITQRFGANPGSTKYYCRADRSHNGLDFGVDTGTQIKAAAEGKVIKADLDSTGYGLHVRIQHSDCMTLYAHLSKIQVEVGAEVKAGDQVGLSGSSGNSTGPHLHFEVRTIAADCKSCIDPLPLLVSTPVITGKNSGVVVLGGLRIREQANINSLIWAFLDVGDTVSFTELMTIDDSTWGKLADGSGWCCIKNSTTVFITMNQEVEPVSVETLSTDEKVKLLWEAHPEIHPS